MFGGYSCAFFYACSSTIHSDDQQQNDNKQSLLTINDSKKQIWCVSPSGLHNATCYASFRDLHTTLKH